MKKISFIILVVALTFSFMGCTEEKNDVVAYIEETYEPSLDYDEIYYNDTMGDELESAEKGISVYYFKDDELVDNIDILELVDSIKGDDITFFVENLSAVGETSLVGERTIVIKYPTDILGDFTKEAIISTLELKK